MNSEIVCPSCGSGMILRTARRGQNVGSQFYGCINFPKCKGISPLSENEQAESRINELTPSHRNNLLLPRIFKARSKYKSNQSKFFDTMAVRNDYLIKKNEDIEFEQFLQPKSKWRIDYPLPTYSSLSDDMQNCLAIMEKILTRGHITRLPQSLERIILEYSISQSNEVDLFHDSDEKDYRDIWVDGYGSEYKFYTSILPEILGPYYREYVTPQVFLSTLVELEEVRMSDQRIDFLINLPDKKIVVELDGVEHEDHKEKDKLRGELLGRAGYTVIRIPNDEIESGYGEQIEQLRNQLTSKPNTMLEGLDIYDSIIKYVHQIQICILEAIYSGTIDLSKEAFVFIDDSNINLNKQDFDFFSNLAIRDFCELGNHVSDLLTSSILFDIKLLRSTDLNYENVVAITYTEGASIRFPTIFIQNLYWQQPIAFSTRDYNPISIKETDEKKPSILFAIYI